MAKIIDQPRTPFRTFSTPRLMPSPKEKVSGKSMTIPDQSMSIRQLFDRQVRGLPLGGYKQPIYDGEDDMWDGIDPKTLDIVERQERIQEVREELTQTKKRVEDRKKPKLPAEDTPGEQPGESTKTS